MSEQLDFDTLRGYARETYLGGYTSDRDIRIFRHGMETVFNFLESKLRDVVGKAAERDELQKRIDAVMALPNKEGAFATYHGYNTALADVRDLLAPKQEARFYAEGAFVFDRFVQSEKPIAQFFTLTAERHARECAERLNAEEGARDE